METIDRVDGERKHLEGLLKDRINFFLIFAPVLVAASYDIEDLQIRAGVLVSGAVVSIPSRWQFFAHTALLRWRSMKSSRVTGTLSPGTGRQFAFPRTRTSSSFGFHSSSLLRSLR
jgi:hypothetical protein